MSKDHKEGLNVDVDSRSQELIEKWKNGPVFLVSSSKVRASTLREFGFTNVSTVSASEESEVESQGKYYHDFSPNLLDKRRHEAVSHVAEGKVRAVLNAENLPAEAMVVAVDTMPGIFMPNIEEDAQTFAILQDLKKPESPERCKDTV